MYCIISCTIYIPRYSMSIPLLFLFFKAVFVFVVVHFDPVRFLCFEGRKLKGQRGKVIMVEATPTLRDEIKAPAFLQQSIPARCHRELSLLRDLHSRGCVNPVFDGRGPFRWRATESETAFRLAGSQRCRASLRVLEECSYVTRDGPLRPPTYLPPRILCLAQCRL